MTEYSYSEKDFHLEILSGETCNSKFDQVLQSKWDDAMRAGHFRYTLNHSKVKKLAGEFGYILQLNPSRAVERRKPDKMTHVRTEFNPDKFNFTKVKPEEILLQMHCNGKHHPVLINVSPLDYGHVLLVPDIDKCLPQCLTPTCIELGLHTILLSQHSGMFIGFNSICGLASVNHLHLHAWFVDHPIYIQRAPVKCIYGNLHETTTIPIPAFVIELRHLNLAKIVRCIHTITQYLYDNNIAHNMAMMRGNVFDSVPNGTNQRMTVRVCIWPRKSDIAQKHEVINPFNVAVAEMSGQIPFYIPEKFDDFTEEDIVNELKEQQLPEGEFQRISQVLATKYADIFETSPLL